MSPYVLPGVTLDADGIIAEVERWYNLSPGAIMTDSQSPKYAFPRFVAMHIIRFTFGWTLQMLTMKFGKTRATIIHATKTVRNEIEVNREFARRYSELCKKIERK